MEGEGFFQALFEAVQGGLIHQLQTQFERGQCLRGRLYEAQRDLLSVEGDAQSDDDFLVREALAVQKQRHQVISFQGALLELGQHASGPGEEIDRIELLLTLANHYRIDLFLMSN